MVCRAGQTIFLLKKISRLLSFLVTAVELVDTTGGINKFLLSGEEGVALGADTNFVLRTGGFDVPHFAASTGHDGIAVGRMDVFFHCFTCLIF